MDELTAEQVWEMVKAHSPTIRELVYIGTAEWGCHSGWHISEEWIAPNHALALIVDAAKREMGDCYIGCGSGWKCKGSKEWVCEFYHRNNPDDSNFSRDGDTEAQAVLAAYKAWKEGR